MPAEDFTPGIVQAVAAGVRRITAPNTGFLTGPGTNTYLVGDDEIAIIDPGPDDAAHLDAIERAAGGRARWILVTHNHPDHSRGARPLADRLDVPVYAHAAPLQGVRDENFEPDRTLAGGDLVEASDFVLRCLHTPGHSADHLCFLHEGHGMLFAGDHVMDGVTVVIAPPDGDMAAYLRSLEHLKGEVIRCIAPGHGGLMAAAAAVFDAVIHHRLARERQVLAALERGERRIDSMVAELYDDVPTALHPVAAWQLYAHLLKLREEGRVAGRDAESTWRLTL